MTVNRDPLTATYKGSLILKNWRKYKESKNAEVRGQQAQHRSERLPGLCKVLGLIPNTEETKQNQTEMKFQCAKDQESVIAQHGGKHSDADKHSIAPNYWLGFKTNKQTTPHKKLHRLNTTLL